MAASLNSDNGVVSGTAGLKSSADSSGVLDLQTNGTTALSISASQVVTYTNQPTYTGGTANGVLYLNGSKAVTSGSALVFNGTNLGVGDASPPAPGGADARVISLKGTKYPQYIYTATDAATDSKTWRTIIRDSLQFQIQTVNDAISTEQTAYEIIRTTGSNSIDYQRWYTATSERMRLDNSGNLGLGVTPSAWGSGFKAFQIGARGSAYSGSDSSMRLAYNAYYDGTGYKRIAASSASQWIADTDGSFGWFQAGSSTAGSAITFTQAMTLGSNGFLGIGQTSPAYPIDISTGANAAQIAFQSTISSGINFKISQGIQGITNSGMQIYDLTNSAIRLAIDGSGNVGIGTGSPNSKLEVKASGANGIVLGVDGADSTASTRMFGKTSSSTGGIFYYENGGNPIWCVTTGSTVGSSTGTTRLTVSEFGLALGNYDAATSGTGIKFPATQNPSSNVNTLDDYEEGSWTPSLRDGGTNRSPSYAYGPSGTYVKIGRFVFIRWGLKLSNKGAGSGSGEIQIYGLPFTPTTTGPYQEENVSVSTGILNTAANAGIARMVINIGSYLFGRLANNADTVWTYNDLTNDSWIIGELSYIATA